MMSEGHCPLLLLGIKIAMEVQIRPVLSNDIENIYNLISGILSVPTKERWISIWSWVHEDNPWLQDGIPVGFVAEVQNHLAGYLGLVPVPLLWQGNEVVCQSSETFIVEPSYQGYGIGHQLAGKAWDSQLVPQPTSFTANAISTHLFGKFGGKAAPAAISSIRVGVLDIEALLQRLQSGSRALRKTARFPCVKVLTKSIVNLYLKAKMRNFNSSDGWSMEPIDSRHPELYDFCKSTVRNDILSVAVTPPYINWRYESAPMIMGRNYHSISIRDRSRCLRAVAVLGEHRHPDWNGIVGEIMELIVDPEADLNRVLTCLIGYGRTRTWATFRSAYLSPEWDRICRLAGMIRHRYSTNERTIVKPVKMLEDSIDVIGIASHWNLGMGCRW